ncbi:unnamed protein product [Pleuronectes platessa]|uniref:Uncharacterized protein n=1 Tax=Pleuronectes platessa TaxID=8262 RepID=A0A9N7YBU2_PLEPL|nr:unnamed protein product [Pleuronectes platessa]
MCSLHTFQSTATRRLLRSGHRDQPWRKDGRVFVAGKTHDFFQRRREDGAEQSSRHSEEIYRRRKHCHALLHAPLPSIRSLLLCSRTEGSVLRDPSRAQREHHAAFEGKYLGEVVSGIGGGCDVPCSVLWLSCILTLLRSCFVAMLQAASSDLFPT